MAIIVATAGCSLPYQREIARRPHGRTAGRPHSVTLPCHALSRSVTASCVLTVVVSCAGIDVTQRAESIGEGIRAREHAYILQPETHPSWSVTGLSRSVTLSCHAVTPTRGPGFDSRWGYFCEGKIPPPGIEPGTSGGREQCN